MKTFKQYLEEADKKDTIIFDIPLIIRVLELAREDIKSDMDLHRVVERLIDIRNKGTLTMDDYDFIANIKEEFVKEHIEKVGSQYRLVSTKTGKNLGTYPSKSGAEKRERQVQYFKHQEEVNKIEEDGMGGAVAAAGPTNVVSGVAGIGAQGTKNPQSEPGGRASVMGNVKRKLPKQ